VNQFPPDIVERMKAVADFIQDRWGSPHPGGAHFLFGDGSVRMIPFSANIGYGLPEDAILAALMTPNGGEVVALPE
jgi:prepilin-type processing-associated H-X9-DG protein